MSIANQKISHTNQKPLMVLPTLEDMGVTRPNQISSYSIRSAGADGDVLKIRYERKKGSFLPQSRIYKFGRSLKAVVADGGTSRIEHTYEISPLLLSAISELDSLVNSRKLKKKAKTSSLDVAKRTELLSELEALETMICGNVSQDNPSAVAARFSKLRTQVSAL